MNKINLFFITMCFNTWASAEFIKISNTGNALPNTAKQWACVLDVQTQLMWEVKNKRGLQNSQSTYTWFDGKSGTKNGEYSRNCQQKNTCNTQAFIQKLNQQTLCQANNWRLPNAEELRSLLHYQDYEPLIDSAYFPNTRPNLYWSSDSLNNTDAAIDIAFFYGGTSGSDKSFDSYVRAVRSVGKRASDYVK